MPGNRATCREVDFLSIGPVMADQSVSDAPKLPYSQYSAMDQEHLARRSKAPLRIRDPTLVRQRIGFHTVTRQDDRVSHDPPLKMLMSRAVLVICLVIQSDPNRAIGPAISNQW